MKKTIVILITIAILALGAMTAVYAMDNNNQYNYGFRGSMMNQNNGNYNSMIEIMRENGFEAAAKAMEDRDFDAMNDLMNNLTDDQYNQMIEIMNNNGYSGMARMMGSYSKDEMLNVHNSMMGRN